MANYELIDYDFASLAKQESDKKIYQRLMILEHLKAGMLQREIGNVLGISLQQVPYWRERFKEEGIDGLKNKPRSGRPPLLEKAKHDELRDKIEQAQSKLKGGRLRGEDMIDLIKQEWDVTYTLNGIYRLMKEIGFSWISSRSKHPKQSAKAQEDFKKSLPS